MKLLTSSTNIITSLNSIGIYTSENLIEHLPYRYDILSYTNENEINDKERVVILGKIVSHPKLVKARNIDIISFHMISVGDKLYSVKIFNRAYLYSVLNYDEFFTIIGTFDKEKNEINVINLKKGEIPIEERYVPIYHIPSLIQPTNYRKLVKRTLEEYGMYINNVIPDYLIEKYVLLSHKDAILKAHFPKDNKELSLALRTLKFEECLEYCLKNKIIRNQNKALVKNNEVEIDTDKINEFIKNLEYKLTKDQVQSIREIVTDMKNRSLMYRLLQGDVGTGKTLVAGIAMYANYLRKRQGVLMAPTDALARQHFDNISKLFKNYDINVSLLVGSMSTKEKNEVLEKIRNGEVDVIIGTHAVFSASSEYFSLGLAIIDEQHRFGVNQRNLLANKGEEVDLLLMSATPIPRTLSLSIYGDLDVSTLETFPNKRRDVKTLVLDYNSSRIEGMIDYCLSKEKQVFIVCPKIKSKGANNDSSVEEIVEKYSRKYAELISSLHGKMKNDEKVEILRKFKEKEIKILVATSIIELGIDIKSATGIIIYSANSFGLASLHQLRGRVGRDGESAYCILVDHFEEGEDDSRLKFLETCSDGFRIAEEDMRLRGPGDFMGIEQSGFPSFNCLNIVSDFKMFEVARNEVQFMMNNLDDKDIAHYYDKIMTITNNLDMQMKLFD